MIKVPGKLYIAGEYAVTSGAPALITTVPLYLKITLTPYKEHAVQSVYTNQEIVPLATSHPHLSLITKSVLLTEQFLKASHYAVDKTFLFSITSELVAKNGEKYGLGSSGAVSVAIIKALLTAYAYPLDQWLIYKLAVLVHLQLGSKGSFGDIAACTFEKTIYYRMVDKNWLHQQMTALPLVELIHSNWKQLVIRYVPLPFPLLVGWSGVPALTEQLVYDVKEKKEHADYASFVQHSTRLVDLLEQACHTKNWRILQESLAANRLALNQLSHHIETPTLKKLCDIGNQYGGSAKSSGAGGGDCGICFVKDKKNIQTIQTEWEKEHIIPLLTIPEDFLYA